MGPFLKPTFRGKRFENHELPFDFLSDIFALQDLLLEIAKWHFRIDNPDRKRLPRGFVDSFKLSLQSITEGSTCPVIARETRASELELDDIFDRSTTTLFTLIGNTAKNGNVSLPLGFPESILDGFEGFGRSLRLDEEMDFSGITENAKYTQAVRNRILSSRSSEYVRPGVVRGEVFEVNRDAFTFTLRNGSDCIQGSYTVEHEAEILNAFDEQYGIPIAISADLVYGRNSKIKRIENITDIKTVNIIGMRTRLSELLTMESAWRDSSRRGQLSTLVDNFLSMWEHNADLDNANPLIFPLDPDGLHLEWSKENRHLEIDISLPDLKGDLTIIDTTSDLIFEIFIDLIDPLSWRIISDSIKNYPTRLLNE